MERVPVIVIGAGPTGLTAATLLARRGVRCLVVDRRPGVYPLPRAVHLDDEVHRVLQALGVHERFAAISRPSLGLRLLDAAHRPMAQFHRDALVGAHGFAQANMFDQPELERLLRANLATLPAARLRESAEVIAVTPASAEGGAPVRVTVRDTTSATISEYAADAVLGCDGAHSITRTVIGADLHDLRFSEDWLVVDVRCPTPLPAWDGVHQVCAGPARTGDPARAATYMRIAEDRYRFEFRLHPGERVEALTAPASLARLLAPWTAGLPFDRLELVRAAAYTFQARIADRWRRGRIFLLGDAAHLTPPFIGQGLGAGLRDAYNLVWKLDLVLAGRADDALLDTYQAERLPHARRLIRFAVLAGWAMTGGQDRAATVRRLALAAASRVPGFATVVLRSMSPPLTRGPLTHRPRLAVRALAGTLCPQPWVTVDGARRRLDDVLGDGFALLTAVPPGPRLRALADEWRARTVLLPGAGPGDLVVADGGALSDWLRRGRAGAVLLRPDRVVLQATTPAASR